MKVDFELQYSASCLIIILILGRISINPNGNAWHGFEQPLEIINKII